MSTLTRERVRRAYRDAGHQDRQNQIVTEANMWSLREAINKRMLAAALMEGTFHMEHPSCIRLRGSYCSLRCNSYYFKAREAVTFKTDGFVGFAGWSDETNVQPIVEGFMDWLPTIRI